MTSGSTVEKLVMFRPRVLVFLAGIAAGALNPARKGVGAADSESVRDLRRAAADLEARVMAHEKSTGARFAEVEARLGDHDTRIASMPSTEQIVAAMEQVLAKSMISLDNRLSTQGNSIEILKTTVSQTDSVLERILESLDSLHSEPVLQDLDEEAMLQLTM